MLSPVDGEVAYGRNYHVALSAVLIALYGHRCLNPWHADNATGPEIHHVESRGRVGEYNLVSNCIPLCRECHNGVNSKIKTLRIVDGQIVTFVFEKLGKTPKAAPLELAEVVISFDGENWKRLK